MRLAPDRPPNFWRSLLIVILVALAYGGAARLLFPSLGRPFHVVSLAFIFFMPFALGALVCYLGYKLDTPRAFWYRSAPAYAILLGILGSYAVHLEALMCLVVAVPLVFPATVLGGWGMHLSLQKRCKDRLLVPCLVLLPYAVAPVEELWDMPHETRVMRNAVTIHATPEAIWEQIHSVPAIQRDELPSQWIYHLGFPRPIAATIDRQGVGATRHATFERGVSFFEEVTRWDQPRKLSFTIKADPGFIPHTAFDEHIIVGGRFYDVLDGTYEIEPRTDGTCILHLSSTHRLSTRFNWYAGWWSEWVMDQIQGSILDVIRRRCEGSGRPSPRPGHVGWEEDPAGGAGFTVPASAGLPPRSPVPR